nr:ribosomal protein S1 [Cyanidioschyzonaceae sp. 2]
MPFQLGQIVHGFVVSRELIDIQHSHLAYIADMDLNSQIGQPIEVLLVAKSNTQWIVSCQALIYSRSISRLLQLHQANLPIWATALQWFKNHGVKVEVEAMKIFIPLAHATPKPPDRFVVKLISVSPLRVSYTYALVEQWANQTLILNVSEVTHHSIKGHINGVPSVLVHWGSLCVEKGDHLAVQMVYFDVQQACVYVSLQEQK